MRKPGMPWWGAILVTLALGAILVLVLAIGALVRSGARGLPFAEAQRVVALDPANLALAQTAACALATWLALRWRREGTLRERLGLRPTPQGVVALAVVAGLAVQFPLAEVSNLLQELWPVPVPQQLRMRQLLTPDDPWDGLTLVLALVVVAPVGEELVFRGAMLPALERRHGPALALGLSAVLFGVTHVGPGGAMIGLGVAATVAGLLFGSVAMRTGSTLPVIAMHGGVNAVPILLPERLIRIPGLNTVSEQVYHLPAPLLLATTVVAAGALLGLMWLSDRAP